MNLPTNPGQTNQQSTPGKQQQGNELNIAINAVFAMFRRSYHQMYHSAFGDLEELNNTKKLWRDMLSGFEPAAIVEGAKSAIASNKYLPSLHEMIRHCEKSCDDTSLPDAHTAYIEACRAASPKANYKWTHLAVYYAGKETDWYFLQTSAENVAYPVFKEKYLDICSQVRAGKKLAKPEPILLAPPKSNPLDKKENLDRLSKLKEALDLDI